MGFCFHHLDLDQLERYLEERERRPEFVRHLVSCSLCSMRLAEERVLRALLAGLGRGEEGDGGGEHLGRDLLEGLVCEALAPEAAARAEEHLGRCDRCLAELLRMKAGIGPVMGAGERGLAVPEAAAERVRRAFRGVAGSKFAGTLRGVFEPLWGVGELLWEPEVPHRFGRVSMMELPVSREERVEELLFGAEEEIVEAFSSGPGAPAWRPVTFELGECRLRLSLEVAEEGGEGLLLVGRIHGAGGRLGGRSWELRVVGHGDPHSFTGEEFRICLPSRVCEVEFGPPLGWRIAVEIDPQPE